MTFLAISLLQIPEALQNDGGAFSSAEANIGEA